MLDSTAIRAAFEHLSREYWSDRYREYRDGRETDTRILESYRMSRDATSTLAAPIQEAFDYYYREVEANDWGSVAIYLNFLYDRYVLVVLTTTDGEDGWVELYSEDGEEIGVGRLYIELIGWGDRDMIRAMTRTGEFPPDLADRASRSLWGK